MTSTENNSNLETQTGEGLLGYYYNDKDFTNSAISKIDSTVDFAWGSGSPDSAIDSDTFSIRWQRTYNLETYR